MSTRWPAIAWAIFVAAVVGVFVSRSVKGDVTFLIVALTAAGYLAYVGLAKQRRSSTVRNRQRMERMAPWSVFSRPCPSQFGMWEVGIHRVADDGSVIESRPPDKITAEEHQLDIEIAVSDAKLKAARWNESQEAM